MATIIYDSSTASLLFDKQNKLIVLKWKKLANSDEYRELFSNLVEFARKNKVLYFLSDLREEGHVPVEDLRWLEKEVLDEAAGLGIVKVAMITEESLFSTIYAETIKRKLKDQPIQVQLFTEYATAQAWILNDEASH